MKRLHVAIALTQAMSSGALAQKPPLLLEKDVEAPANEISGETTRTNIAPRVCLLNP
jgi:hypothetical protein